MISGAAIAVGYRLRREVDPSESRLNRDACPKPASVLPPTSLSHAAGGETSGTSGVSSMLRRGRQRGPGATSANGAPAAAQPIARASSRRARRYFRISSARTCIVASGSPGVELCDDPHALPALLFIALPPVFGLRQFASLPSAAILRRTTIGNDTPRSCLRCSRESPNGSTDGAIAISSRLSHPWAPPRRDGKCIPQ